MKNIPKAKHVLFFFFSVVCTASCCYAQYRPAEELLGEKLGYEVKYGFFKVAEAKMTIAPTLQKIDSVVDPLFYLTFNVRSVGLLQFFYSNLQLSYRSYISSGDISPHYSERELRHGKKVDLQHDYFTLDDSTMYVANHRITSDTVRYDTFALSNTIAKDVLSLYLWFRSADLSAITNETPFDYYLVNRLNGFSVQPTNDYMDYKGIKAKKFVLKWERVKELPPNKENYALVDLSSGKVLKAHLNTDIGKVNFSLKEGL